MSKQSKSKFFIIILIFIFTFILSHSLGARSLYAYYEKFYYLPYEQVRTAIRVISCESDDYCCQCRSFCRGVRSRYMDECLEKVHEDLFVCFLDICVPNLYAILYPGYFEERVMACKESAESKAEPCFHDCDSNWCPDELPSENNSWDVLEP